MIYEILLVFIGLAFAVEDCPNDWAYGIPNHNNLVADEDVRRSLIVMGEESTPHEYPWQVALRLGMYSCGGSIIGREWVLTAAHCASGETATVIAGLNDVTIQGKMMVHEGYNDNTLVNDIALIKLDEPLPCDNPNIRALSLMDKSNGFDLNDCSAWITGFGTLYSGGPGPVHEFDNFEVQTRIYDTDYCNSADQSYYRNLPPTQLCGFTPGNPLEDSCQGDSGGPFFIDTDVSSDSHRYVQAGVVSYGNGCGSSAGVYTDISEFKDWILSKYPGAEFTTTNACDRDHYHEGILECEGNDTCELKLPECLDNADSWQSSGGRSCGDYASTNRGKRCYADKNNSGVYAYQICHQCTQCVGADGENSDWSGDPNNNGGNVTPPEPPSTPEQEQSDCASNEQLVSITLFTGNWGAEISLNVDGRFCEFSGTLPNEQSFTGTCCLSTGQHEFHCMDSYGDGWNGAHVDISSGRHCNFFADGTLHTSSFYVGAGGETPTVQPTEVVTTVAPESTVLPSGSVCVDIQLQTLNWGSELSWAFGDCQSAPTEGAYYGDNSQYTQSCCVQAGNIILQCIDSYGDGWNGASITINGNSFCSDFSGGSEQGYEMILANDGSVSNSQTTTSTAAPTEAGSVCFDITLQTDKYGNEVSWTIGNCQGDGYGSDQTYDRTCCVLPGDYTFNCVDSFGDGWHGGYITFSGTDGRICESFQTGYEYGYTVTVGESGAITIGEPLIPESTVAPISEECDYALVTDSLRCDPSKAQAQDDHTLESCYMWARDNDKTHFAYRESNTRCMIDDGDGSDACSVDAVAANPSWSQYEIECGDAGASDDDSEDDTDPDTTTSTKEPTMEPTPPPIVDQETTLVEATTAAPETTQRETCTWVDMCPNASCHCRGQYEQTNPPLTSADCRARAEDEGWPYYITRDDIDRCRRPTGDVETNCQNGGSSSSNLWTTYQWECSADDSSSDSVDDTDDTTDDSVDEVDDGTIIIQGCRNAVVDLGGGYYKCTGKGTVTEGTTLAQCAEQAYDAGVYYYTHMERANGDLKCKIPEDADQAQSLCMGATTWEWQVYHLDCSSSDTGGDSGDDTTGGDSEDSTDLDTKTPTKEPTLEPIEAALETTASVACEGSAPYMSHTDARCVAGGTTVLSDMTLEQCNAAAMERDWTHFEYREDRSKCGVPKSQNEQCSDSQGIRTGLTLWDIYTTDCNQSTPSENDDETEPVVYDTPDAENMDIIRNKFTKTANGNRFRAIGDRVDEILDAGLNYDPQVQDKLEEMRSIHVQNFSSDRFSQSGNVFAEIELLL